MTVPRVGYKIITQSTSETSNKESSAVAEKILVNAEQQGDSKKNGFLASKLNTAKARYISYFASSIFLMGIIFNLINIFDEKNKVENNRNYNIVTKSNDNSSKITLLINSGDKSTSFIKELVNKLTCDSIVAYDADDKIEKFGIYFREKKTGRSFIGLNVDQKEVISYLNESGCY